MIKIADKSKDRWLVVEEYESDDLASDTDDEKRLKPVFHLATLFARREAKTRIQHRDWLKLVGEKILHEQVGTVPTLLSVRANKFAKWKTRLKKARSQAEKRRKKSSRGNDPKKFRSEDNRFFSGWDIMLSLKTRYFVRSQLVGVMNNTQSSTSGVQSQIRQNPISAYPFSYAPRPNSCENLLSFEPTAPGCFSSTFETRDL